MLTDWYCFKILCELEGVVKSPIQVEQVQTVANLLFIDCYDFICKRIRYSLDSVIQRVNQSVKGGQEWSWGKIST